MRRRKATDGFLCYSRSIMRPRPFALERFFARTEFSARHLLATSDCEGLSLDELLTLAPPPLLARWQKLSLGYTESDGAPELRAEIADLYGTVEPEGVLVAAPEEAIFLFMNALLEPGDHVVCTFPGYQSLYQLALTLGCRVTLWGPLEEEERWYFDPGRLEEVLRPETRLVIWNFPHNPTGALPSPSDFEHMVAAVREVGAWVFSDEMYRLLERSADSRLPAAVDLYERAVSLAGMSKVFGLAGLRIGWLASHDQAILQRCREMKDYTTICSSAPSEMLSLIGLRAREHLLERHRLRVDGNVALAAGLFDRHSGLLSWVPPQGGTVCLPRLRAGSAESFCARLLEERGVLLLPSTVYDFADSHFRLGLGRSDFGEGLEVLSAYLDEFCRA